MTMVKLDRIDTAELHESKGVITRVRRTAYVSGLSSVGHEKLIEALVEGGVPTSGSTLAGDGCADLRLTERTVKMVSRDDAEIDLVYELYYESNYVNANSPPYSVFDGVMKTSVQQVTTNKDADGELLVVSHTYPADDEDYPSKTVEQGGEITIYQPQKTFTLRLLKNTASPWVLTDALLGKVNSAAWAGDVERTWMCSSISWKVHKIDNQEQYDYEIEFQFNPATWDPVVTFIDDRTGKPPKDLVEGEGYYTVEYLEQVPFESILGYGIIGVT